MTALDTNNFFEDLAFNISDSFEQTGYDDVKVETATSCLIYIKVDTIGTCITIDVTGIGSIKLNINQYFKGILSLLIAIDSAYQKTTDQWYC